MEGIKDALKRHKKKKNPNLHSDAHVLADEMCSYFREPKRFGMYLGIIKRLGTQRTRALFSRVKSERDAAHDPKKLFMWLTRNPDEKSETG